MKHRKSQCLLALRLALACVSLAVFLLAFFGVAPCCMAIARLQFGPSLLLCATAVGAGALTATLAILVVSFLFGRFYCSFVCPLGLIQDAISLVTRKFSKAPVNLPWLRYAIAGFVFAALFCGAPFFLRMLDPYANAGRIVAAFRFGGLVALAAIVLLALFRRRAFCVTLCPVGTLLGLAAKRGVFGMRIGGDCVKCGKCAKGCPTGAIDVAAQIIDNERCIRCAKCAASCPRDAISFGINTCCGSAKKRRAVFSDASDGLKDAVQGGGIDTARRDFIVNGGLLVAGATLGAIAAKTGLARKCEHIGVATFSAASCLVFQEDIQCGKCAAACHASAIELRANGTPKMPKAEKCIGCGACEAVCPARPKAMRVVFVGD